MEDREFEGLLRSSLERRSMEITPSPDFVQQIKSQLRVHEPRRASDRLTLWKQMWHRSAWRRSAAAFCCIVVVLALVFAFSAPARVWATDTFMRVFKIHRTPAGYQAIPTAPGTGGSVTIQSSSPGTIPLTATSTGTQTSVVVTPVTKPRADSAFSSPEEVREKLRLPLVLPSHVPDGYRLASISGDQPQVKSNGKIVGSFKVADATYVRDGRQRLQLFVSDNEEFMRGDALSSVIIQGQEAQWAEYPVVSFTQDSQTTAVGHMLRWETKGVVYVLANDSAELTVEEMIRVAETVIGQ